jgi:hypothetical protein
MPNVTSKLTYTVTLSDKQYKVLLRGLVNLAKQGTLAVSVADRVDAWQLNKELLTAQKHQLHDLMKSVVDAETKVSVIEIEEEKKNENANNK